MSALPFLYSAELQPLVIPVRNFVRICGTQSLKVVYCYPVPAVQISTSLKWAVVVYPLRIKQNFGVQEKTISYDAEL